MTGPMPLGSALGAAPTDQHPWPMTSRLELGSLPTAVPCARLHTKHIVKEWNLAHLTDTAELIVSELVTNALRASRSLPDLPPVILRLLASPEQLIIKVWDASSTPPSQRPHGIDAESGRGLEIVSYLSEDWGFYHPDMGGKVVWATLAARSDTPDGDDPPEADLTTWPAW